MTDRVITTETAAAWGHGFLTGCAVSMLYLTGLILGWWP